MRTIGRWAAFVAAYALVFNVMLTTALVASISPFDYSARHQLCLNAVSTSQTGDASDQGKTIVSCPLCVSSAVSVADVPPLSPALIIRIALLVPYETPDLDVITSRVSHRDQQPRGPPHLS